MLLSNQIMMGTAMFDPIPPIVWKEGGHNIVIGADLAKIRLQLISPCVNLKKLNSTSAEQAMRLETWCSEMYWTHVMQRLKAHQTSHKRTQRDLTSLLIAGASTGLLPALGIPIAVVSIVGVIIFGVVRYVKVAGRLNDLENQTEELEKGLRQTSTQLEIEK
jgi:hypothetical protein